MWLLVGVVAKTICMGLLVGVVAKENVHGAASRSSSQDNIHDLLGGVFYCQGTRKVSCILGFSAAVRDTAQVA